MATDKAQCACQDTGHRCTVVETPQVYPLPFHEMTVNVAMLALNSALSPQSPPIIGMLFF